MADLEFSDDGKGNFELSNELFDGRIFAELKIAPRIGNTMSIRNTKFVGCKTLPGTCVIRSGVTLEDVTFSNLDCGDALRISSEATLRRVVVEGKRPKSLIVQPENEQRFVTRPCDNCGFQLDVSQFDGSVTIVGLRGDMVRKNPERHVTVKARWKNEVPWNDLGIGPFSYWRIFAVKVAVCRAEEGVFSLPKHSG
jgi:hypothetical protein